MSEKLENIPIHDFSKDDDSSIAFKFVPLEKKTGYDSSSPHRHNYYEIFLFEKGGGKHDLDFNTYEIKSNSIHFVSPGQVHQVKRALNTHGAVILFSRDFYYLGAENKQLLFELPFLNNIGASPVLNLSKEQMKSIIPILSGIKNELDKAGSHHEDIIRSFLNILLMQGNQYYSQTYPETHHSLTDSTYKQFRLLLENNFRTMRKVKEFAKQLKISEKVLNEAVKKATGETASEHIFSRIILEAKRLLKHSQLSIKEIAYFLNFSDPAHFSKFFKTQGGLSAEDFRKQ